MTNQEVVTQPLSGRTCWPIRSQRKSRKDSATTNGGSRVDCGRLTINELSLPLDDLVAQVSVLLEALHYKVLLPDDVVLEQRVRLHLCVLDLQLVDLAQEAQDLALLLRAHPPWEQLLQAPSSIPELQESTLQQRLGEEQKKKRSV